MVSAAPVSNEPKTVDDLLALEAATERRYEIVDGEFVELPVSRDSSFVNTKFNRYLDEYVERTATGEVYDGEMLYILPKSMRKADAGVVFTARLPEGDVSRFAGPPDLVVEVLSPSDVYSKVRRKIQEWLDAGAQVVWLATPESREVTIYRRGQRPLTLTQDDTLDGGDLLPGFSVEVARLFPARPYVPEPEVLADAE